MTAFRGIFLVVSFLFFLSSSNSLSEHQADNDGDKQQEQLRRTRVIRTKYGQVQGRVHKIRSDFVNLPDVEIYQGIRYATPPVGSNRWQPTRAPSPWKGVLQATSPGPVCPQKFPDIGNETEALLRMPRARLRFLQFVRPWLLRQSEDCLYLNIFIPRGSEKAKNELLPIMIYVHGESFKWGSGNLWDARILSAFGSVMIVTFNYRLGILGFLNTNAAPTSRAQVANYGLMDQTAVLQWVQENGRQFGGDPNRVTLFGHGTGAACIEYLAHSPTTVPGLFHRVILMSGSIFAPWSRVRDPLSYAKQLAEKFNCTSDNGKESAAKEDEEWLVRCLRSVSPERLMAARIAVPSFHLDFGPSFDGVVVKDNFADIKGKRSFGARTYEAIVGVVSHDFFDDLSDSSVRRGIALERRDRVFQTFVRNQYSAHLKEILLTLQNEYTDWAATEQTPQMIKEQVLSALSDGLYSSPAVFSLGTFYRRTEKAFFYHFAHKTKSGPYSTSHGHSTHGSELAFVFGVPLQPEIWRHVAHSFTEQEAQLSMQVMTYWTNFAKTGNPNKPVRFAWKEEEQLRREEKVVQWEKYDQRSKFLELDVPPSHGHHFRSHKMSIWLNLIPQLHKTGQSAIFPSHNSLTLDNSMDNWGIVRNVSLAATDKNAAMMTANNNCNNAAMTHDTHNDTLVRIQEASKHAYSYVLMASVALGGLFCLINVAILLCICQRRQKLMQHHQRERRNSSLSKTSDDYFQPSPRNQHQHRVIADISGAVRHHELHQEPLPCDSPTPRAAAAGQRTLLVQPRPPLRSALRNSTSYDQRSASPMATIKTTRTRTGPMHGQEPESELMHMAEIPAPPEEFNSENNLDELLMTTHFRHED